ncbi:hypothetical protein DL769_001563 [Monosporascus sp. CRB-8-3]|nr:hypothetical protein DL769_001563 [Monosporascus sp. CRB-8-3]
MAKADHPLGPRLPTPSARLPVVGNPDDFVDQACGARLDATLVTLHWLHIACDALGFKALIERWILIIQGREHEVLSLHSYDEDRRKNRFGLENNSDFTIRAKENRMVYIPVSFMETLRTSAGEELVAASTLRDERPFLKEGDVLVA